MLPHTHAGTRPHLGYAIAPQPLTLCVIDLILEEDLVWYSTVSIFVRDLSLSLVWHWPGADRVKAWTNIRGPAGPGGESVQMKSISSIKR